MRIVCDEEFKTALENKDFLNIMHAASKTYIAKMGMRRVKECRHIALWQSLRDFNDTKNTKFTSYLYQRVRWECARGWKEHKKEKFESSRNKSFTSMKDDELSIILAKTPANISDIQMSLTNEELELVQSRFFDMKTLKEIGDEKGVSLQAIQQRILRIKDKMK